MSERIRKGVKLNEAERQLHAALIALQRIYIANDIEAAHAIAAGTLAVLAPTALEYMLDAEERR